MLDDITFQQLKESNYYHPEVTEVIYDNNIMLDMAVGAMQISEIGFDAVWDSHLCNWASKYFLDGIRLVEKQVRERGIKVKHLVDVTLENIDFIKSLKSFEIRHLDGLRSNFGIFDKRTYMVFILHKESEEPLQTFFSNSKSLVERQQQLFDKLWNMSMPVETRIKELDYERIPNITKNN
jgi:hypothetical protein